MTADLVLERFCYDETGTFGRLYLPDVVLYTVERPWQNNQPRVSCIPHGTYELQSRHFFRGGYDAIEICGVPDRSHILFHVANWPHEVEGCVGVGARMGFAAGAGLMVASSRVAFEKLMEWWRFLYPTTTHPGMAGRLEPYTLDIRPTYEIRKALEWPPEKTLDRS